MEAGKSQEYIQILIQTLSRQKSVLQDILEVTKEQGKIAAGEEFDEKAFEETLTKKEGLITRLNETDDGFVSVYGRVRNEVKGNTDLYKEELKQLQSLIKECTDISVEIKVLEERNREKLVQCFSVKGKQYSLRQNAATVALKYNRFMPNGAKKMDIEVK